MLDYANIQEVMDNFANSRFLSSSFVTESGTQLLSSSYENPFCKLMTSTKKGAEICHNFRAKSLHNILAAGKPMIVRCECGLIYMGCPILTTKNIPCVLICGQVLFHKYCERDISEILEKRLSLISQPAREKLKEHFMNIQIIDESLVSEVFEWMDFIMSHLHRLFFAPDNIPSNNIDHKLIEKSITAFQVSELRGQLNPHFLFNTLNSISQLAMIEGASSTQDLTFQFAEYLRYVLRRQSKQDLVSLKLELECITKFLEIHRIRFRDKINYRIRVAKDLEKYMIPFMLLQPIVENAVIHGLEPSTSKGIVNVDAERLGSFIYIYVTDNGVGCDFSKNSFGIGLTNVQKRLALHYGTEGKLSCDSSMGRGTRITIRIPQ